MVLEGEKIMKIVICNAKGGVGKTTTAIHLACAASKAGLKTRVYDADMQASASLWADACAEHGSPLPFDVLPANISTVLKPTIDDELVFLDTPPAGALLEKAIYNADLIIIPSSDTAIDYMQTFNLQRGIPTTTPFKVLITRAETHTTAYKALVDALDAQRVPRFQNVIVKRQPLKLVMGTFPKNLYEYEQVFSELLAMRNKH